MNIKSRISALIAPSVAVGLLVGSLIQYNAPVAVFSDSNAPVILIDAGHGAPGLCFKNPLQRALK